VIVLRDVSKVFSVPHERPRTLFHRLFGHGRSFEAWNALDRVSLSVSAGSCMALMGRNGSGKSTLLRIVAGIYPPSSGEVEVGGAVAPILDLGVGFRGALSVRQNVLLYGVLLGVPRDELLRDGPAILDEAGVARFADTRLEILSTGLRARLAFTLAMRAQAPVVLIDETLAVGDEAFRQRCFSQIAGLRAAGRTILFVSHDLSLVERLCDRAFVLEAGRVKAEGPPLEMIAVYKAS
jgi:ABC-type polysaccharide/polyol phosphate transport system ATPase subunit